MDKIRTVKYLKLVLVIVLFFLSLVLLLWEGQPHFRTLLALILAGLGGFYTHKFRELRG